MKNLKYYFDAIRFRLRKGTNDDPYILKTGQYSIINGRTGLDEVPDITYKVRVLGYIEVPREKYDYTKMLLDNEYYVDYSNGEVIFNTSQNGKTVSIEYKGRGIIQYPAERIYVHSPNPWAVDNLQELIDFIFQKEQELKEAVANATIFIEQKTNEFTIFVQQKTDELNNKVDEFKDFVHAKTLWLINKTNEYEHYIDGWIDKANLKIDEMNEKIKEAINVINIGKDATEDCKKATDNCVKTTINSKVIWKPSIPSFVHINEKYPFPEIGWTTICDDNGDIIRFDGSAWIKIGNIVGTVPLVTKLRNGLMAKEDKAKLDGIKPYAEPNLKGKELKTEIPSELKIKSIIFTIPNEVRAGDLGIILQAPFEGKVTRVTAYSQEPCISGEWGEFAILKCPLNKLNPYDNWNEITDKYNRIRFLGNSRLAESPQLTTRDIGRYDLFRVICTRQAEGLSNITIQIDYEI